MWPVRWCVQCSGRWSSCVSGPVVSGPFEHPVASAVAGPVASGKFDCPVARLVVQWLVQWCDQCSSQCSSCVSRPSGQWFISMSTGQCSNRSSGQWLICVSSSGHSSVSLVVSTVAGLSSGRSGGKSSVGQGVTVLCPVVQWCGRSSGWSSDQFSSLVVVRSDVSSSG